jgi:hypothetical protein
MMLLSGLSFLKKYIFIQFSVSLFEPCATILGRVVPPPLPVQLAEGPEYEVEAILDSKLIRNKLYYLVDWVVNSWNSSSKGMIY